MIITQESPRQADIIELLKQLDAYLAALYPAESNHLLELESLTGADVTFLAARDEQGTLAGCCSFVGRAAYAELKRMVVVPALRGQGVGAALLAAIVTRARAAGFASLKLETGVAQPEALGLYRHAGFSEIAPFGDYPNDPLSIFMEKRL